MTISGWFMMISCWSVIIGLSGYLLYKTLANPRHEDE